MPSDQNQPPPRAYKEPHARDERAHKRRSTHPDPHRVHPKPEKRKRSA